MGWRARGNAVIYSYGSAVINFITLFLATDQIPAWTTSCFDQVIGRFEKDPQRGQLISFVSCASVLSKRNEGERTSKQKEVNLSPSTDLFGRWRMKWTAARKAPWERRKCLVKSETERHWSVAQICLKKERAMERKTRERGEEKWVILFPQKNRKTKKSYNEKPHCLQMHWGGEFPSSECVLRLRQLWKFIRQAFELTFVQNRHG